ncbi:hypothetical protein ABH935_008872 [Catenulispora sp. GAS73]|uniref:DUF1905 domain-containing protein n=1 Tax=Catenulispora sp. GAS73 TaxID=3156269 RepID=UPI003518242F
MMVTFDAELWLWEARADSWTFVTVPADVSEDIRELAAAPRRGFGSVRVQAAIGGSVWRTSIFPDGAHGCYVMPVKAKVRKAEGLDVGGTASVSIELVDF